MAVTCGLFCAITARDANQAGKLQNAYCEASFPDTGDVMNSRPNHDPFEHLATKEALTAVATRLDATLPHLATKADVKEVSNRFQTVLIGAIVTCFLAFYGMYSSMLDRLALVQQQIYASQQAAAAGQGELHAELRNLSREQQILASEVRHLAATSDERLKRLEAGNGVPSKPAQRR